MNGIKIISIYNKASVNNKINIKPYKNSIKIKQVRMYVEEGFYSPTQPYLIPKEGK